MNRIPLFITGMDT